MRRERLVNTALTLAYRAAYAARGIVWSIARPSLFGVRALVLRGDHVLLIRHRSGETPWSLPGGAVDPHERLEEAARREVYEETGLPAEYQRLLGVYDAFRGDYVNYIVVFVFTVKDGPRPPRSIEIAEARFFRLDSLPETLDPGSQRRIAEYCAGATGVSALW